MRLGTATLSGPTFDTRIDGAWISPADHSGLQDLFGHVSQSCLRHGRVSGFSMRDNGWGWRLGSRTGLDLPFMLSANFSLVNVAETGTG